MHVVTSNPSAPPRGLLARIAGLQMPDLSDLHGVPDEMSGVGHRPWPLPDGPWVMRMAWEDLAFLHWPVPLDALRRCVPEALEIDTLEGRAWLAVTPLHMVDVRPRGLPAMPWMSHFPELNVRTYVTLAGKPGVYFFSLDAASALAVAAARSAYGLRYFRAEMSIHHRKDWVEYTSRRTHAGAAPADFAARYRPIGDARRSRPSTPEHWLTERYCLYTVDSDGQPWRAEIHHAPWSLQPAEVIVERNTMTQSLRIELSDAPPLVHFSKRLDVVAWLPERVR